jgi:hypothetical protein
LVDITWIWWNENFEFFLLYAKIVYKIRLVNWITFHFNKKPYIFIKLLSILLTCCLLLVAEFKIFIMEVHIQFQLLSHHVKLFSFIFCKRLTPLPWHNLISKNLMFSYTTLQVFNTKSFEVCHIILQAFYSYPIPYFETLNVAQ